MPKLKDLAKLASSYTVLIVEDNKTLLTKLQQFLQKFFHTVLSARDGREGLHLYRQHKPQIVITDIKMPEMDGITFIKKLRFNDPEVKILILSAFDDKEYLYTAIELGVFRFLKKPLVLEEFTQTLIKLLELMQHEARIQLLKSYEGSDNMVVVCENKTPVLASDRFLDFFALNDIEEFNEKYGDLEDLFLKQEGFLYSDSISWKEKLLANMQQSHQAMIKDSKGKIRHLMLKAYPLQMPQLSREDSAVVLSMVDITGLELLPHQEKEISAQKQQEATVKVLNYLKENGSEVHLHNFYRGLTITDKGKIAFVSKDRIALKTRANQQKAIKKQNWVVIHSPLLPKDVICEEVEKLDEEKHITTMKRYHLIDSSPSKRRTIRVEPKEDMRMQLCFNEHCFEAEQIEDISINSVRCTLFALPAGLEKGSKVMITLQQEGGLTLEFEAAIFKIWMQEMHYEVVANYNLDAEKEQPLVHYISRRQMELIREFKHL